MRIGRCLTIIALLFLPWAMGVAARVVCVTMDRVPASVGLSRVRAAVSPHGDAAMALVMARTGNDGQQRMIGESYLTVNAERPCGLPRPLPLFMREEAAWLAMLKEACPTVGQLGETLRAHGLRTGAIGSKEAFALLMDGEGMVDRNDPVRLQPTPEDLARARALLAAVDIAVVNVSSGEAMLGWLRTLLDGLEADTRVLVCSIDPPLASGVPWPAGWALWLAAPDGATALTSSSTRRAGIVVNTDIGPTLLTWVGHPEPARFGAPIVARGQVTVDRLLAIETGLYQRVLWRNRVFLGLVNMLIFTMALLTFAGLGRGGANRLGRTISRAIATLVPATWLIYACTGLTPTSWPGLLGEFALGLALVIAVSVIFRRRRVLALWAGAGVVVLAGTLLLTEWNIFNQASFIILKDSRYYGLGNPTAGLVAIGALALALWWPTRLLLALGLLWATAGWIFWTRGAANFGMGIACAVQAVAYGVACAPRAARVKWTMAFAGSAVLLLAILVWYDLATGASSHIGKLVVAIAADGLAPLWEVIARKGLAAWRLLVNSSWTYLLLLALAALSIHLGRCGSWWQQSARARLLLGVGFTTLVASLLVNDSGVEPASLLALFLITGFLGLEEEEEEEEAAPIPAAEQAT